MGRRDAAAARLLLLLAGGGALAALVAAVRPSPTGAEAPARPDRAAVGTELASVPCLAAVEEVAADGTVRLDGTAGAPELAEEAGRLAAAVPGVAAVDNRLAVVPAPGCHAAARVLRVVGPPVRGVPALVLNRADGVYVDGDHLAVTATMPKGLGGQLYLDVLTDAGTAYHLLPEPMRAGNELPPGGRVRVGVEAEERALDVRHWQVGPPFGAGYLVAVASERPLYAEPRPIEEPLAGYLPVLLAGLADPATGGKAARVQRIEFRPRD